MSRISDSAEILTDLQSKLQSSGGGQGTGVADAASATVAALTANSAAVISGSTTVDASGGGSAQTTAIVTVPAQSLLLSVQARVVTAFDGDTTQTLEVGVSGNSDAYIDTVDFDPAAAAGTDYAMNGGANNDITNPQWIDDATGIEALWTNDANAAAGEVEVAYIYITFEANDLDTQFDAIIADVADIRTQLNALITSLEGAGHIATV